MTNIEMFRKNSPGCPTEADRNGKLSGSGTEGQ